MPYSYSHVNLFYGLIQALWLTHSPWKLAWCRMWSAQTALLQTECVIPLIKTLPQVVAPESGSIKKKKKKTRTSHLYTALEATSSCDVNGSLG